MRCDSCATSEQSRKPAKAEAWCHLRPNRLWHSFSLLRVLQMLILGQFFEFD
jgi:hypothetical protein